MDCTVKNQRRVAVYCRVCSDSEVAGSRKVMEDYYTAMVRDNPEWTLVHVFTDERWACPSLEKRQGFQKMLRLCREGEIDLILTQSITTFSRTIYDAMKTIRELQALDIPVIFEKEGLNTSSPDTETLINLYAAFAKAESESLPPYDEAVKNLEKVNWLVDCVLTHCLPTSVMERLSTDYIPDKLTDFLEMVMRRCRFDFWYAGHYHQNRVVDDRFIIQREQVTELKQSPLRQQIAGADDTQENDSISIKF